MTLTLARTSEYDGLWIKILQDGLTIKVWKLEEGRENLIQIEAEVYFDKLINSATNFEILKQVTI